MAEDVRPENGDHTATSNRISHPSPTPNPLQPETIFRSLSTYPFDSDPEYLAGLAAILGHPDTLPTEVEISEKQHLALQAQCFYFSRKYNLPPIDALAYTSWRQNQTRTESVPRHAHSTSAPSTSTSTSQGGESSQGLQTQPQASEPSSSDPTTDITTQIADSDAQPPYPTSFAAIVDLITRNLPVPGIEEIPDTVLEPGSSKVDKTPRRKKPWETDESQSTTAPSTNERSPDPTLDAESLRSSGQGVVNILKPSAVPDSGLLGKE